VRRLWQALGVLTLLLLMPSVALGQYESVRYNTISGWLDVDQRPGGHSMAGEPCVGDVPHLVFTGQTVSVYDDTGMLAAVGSLGPGAGTQGGDCYFKFQITGVPESSVYHMYVGDILVTGFGVTSQMLSANNWTVYFNLTYL
jgi:hypothetical protein